MKFQNVKGTRDFYPQDMAVRNWLTDLWRRVSARHGFVEYDGPTFEFLDLYKAKSGEGIVSELFHFEDRGGRQLALRPEMTPTLARMVAARAQTLPKPIKWFCVPNFFRAERPQRGRLREFWQWNIDIITEEGAETELADVECVFVALDLLRQAGLSSEQVELRLNSRQLLSGILAELGLPGAAHEAIFMVLDKRDKLPAEVFEAEVGKLGLDPGQALALLELGRADGASGFEYAARLLDSADSEDGPAGRLRRLLTTLEDLGVGAYCRFDPGVVRGLAYYTDLVFEAYSKGTLRRALLGGGRYGRLLAALGGPPLTGVGFGMGDVILIDQLREMDLLPDTAVGVDFFVVPDGDVQLAGLMRVVGLVREHGHSCGLSYRRGSLKKQLQQAVAHNVKQVIIVASDSAGSSAVRIKRLADMRQVEMDVAALVATLTRSGGLEEVFDAGDR